MPVVTYEEIIPSPIENTTAIKVLADGTHRTTRITPNEGYVLHDKDLDEEVIDPDTYELTGDIKLGFYSGTRSVRYDYDFVANPREFYAVLESEMPEGTKKL